MPYYAILSKLTENGRKTIMKNPGRIWEVNKDVEEMGARIITQFFLLGQYDFLNIIEAPNNTVVARVAATIGARGSIEPLTMAAITIEDLVKEIQMANALIKK